MGQMDALGSASLTAVLLVRQLCRPQVVVFTLLRDTRAFIESFGFPCPFLGLGSCVLIWVMHSCLFCHSSRVLPFPPPSPRLVLTGPVWGAYAVDLAGINLIAHSIAPLLLVTVLVAFCVMRELVDSSATAVAGVGGGGGVDEEAGAGQVHDRRNHVVGGTMMLFGIVSFAASVSLLHRRVNYIV